MRVCSCVYRTKILPTAVPRRAVGESHLLKGEFLPTPLPRGAIIDESRRLRPVPRLKPRAVAVMPTAYLPHRSGEARPTQATRRGARRTRVDVQCGGDDLHRALRVARHLGDPRLGASLLDDPPREPLPPVFIRAEATDHLHTCLSRASQRSLTTPVATPINVWAVRTHRHQRPPCMGPPP